MDKNELLEKGIRLMELFCEENNLPVPEVRILKLGDHGYRLGSCAFYRNGVITIMPKKCAHPGNGIWSWPGYVIDRTPYGVIQHELGHHADHSIKGLLKHWMELKESPITGYHGTGDGWTPHENRAEDFAEMFRLFVTNPALLHDIRYRTYAFLDGEGFLPVVNCHNWKSILRDAPGGIIRAATNKIKKGAIKSEKGKWI